MALRGTVRVPGDKSISHRALLLPALARGPTRIRGLGWNEDVERSKRLVEALGVQVRRDGSDWIVEPGPLREPGAVIDCGNSGTTLRIGAGVLAHAPGLRVLSGDPSLRRRPMRRIVEPLRSLGLTMRGRRRGTRAPLVLEGGVERPGAFALEVASAQVKSALLVACRDVGCRLVEPRPSRDHTERLLRAMGARLRSEEEALILEPGPWEGTTIDIPGDLSSAAFWLGAASIVPGSEVFLPDVGLNPTRDGVLRALLAMGADIAVENRRDGVEPRGDLRVRSADLQGIRIDGELALACLDELPLLAVVASQACGETIIADAAELRVKESDRIAEVVAGLRACGIQVEERHDGMVIQGGRFRGAQPRIDARHDHRLAMAFTVAGLCHPRGVEIVHAESVRTSYPSFFEDLERLRECG